ncbi:MAG: FHA domain-containing protein [Planctomycetota bacterium]|jgi:hypothetical protein
MASVELEVDAGNRYREENELVVLGRADDCDLHIVAEQVSRRHAELALLRGRWKVRDLDSSNGTYLNGQRIATADLRPGDVIRLGESGPKVRVVALDPAPPADLEETRFLRVTSSSPAPAVPEITIVKKETPPAPAPPAPPAPRRPVGEPSPEPEQPRPRRRPSRAWLPLFGIVFGVVAGLNAVPYADIVAAPALWATYGLVETFPELLPKLGWLFVIVVGAYFGSLGLALQRPRASWPWLVLLAAAHVAAYYHPLQ